MTTTKKTGFETEETSELMAANSDAMSLADLKVQKLELQDTSKRLPVGFLLPSGERLTDFDLHPYTTEHDLLLTKRNNEDIHITLGRILPQLVKSIGGYSVPDLAKELSTSPERMFQQMLLADAFALILWIRLETVGADVAISEQCPRCNTENKDSAEKGYHDLGRVDIGMAINLSRPLAIAVELKTGFVEFGHTAKTVLLRPLRLYQSKEFKSVPSNKMDIEMLYKMCFGLPEITEYEGMHSNLLNDGIYRKLTLADRNTLLGAMKELMKLGPQMVIEMECEACQNAWRSALPWQFLRTFLSEPAGSGE